MNQKKRIAILRRFQENQLHPKTELNYSSIFELLISVLLSAKTKDSRVNKVTSKLYYIANTPQEILNLGVENIKFYIKTLGLFNKKAENIIKVCRILIEKYNGKIPEDRIALEALPGIGRKTANVILNTGFGWPTIAVDTHIFRVCNRINFVVGNNVEEIEKKLIKIVPLKFKTNFHYWFLLHGRYTCIARKPRCKFCIIEDMCEYKIKYTTS